QVVGRRGVRQERNDVEAGEGQYREQRAAGKPLELLALQGIFFAAIAPPEDARGHQIEDGEVGVIDLVETVDQLAGRLPDLLREVAEDQQDRAGKIQQRIEEVAAGARLFVVGETDREVQEERGLQRGRDVVAPQHPEIERIELAGVLERVEGERRQAEDVEMSGLRGGPAPEEDVQADGEIDQCDKAKDLVVGAVVIGAGLEDDLDGEGRGLAVGGGALDRILRRGKHAAAVDGADGVGEVGGGLVVDRRNDVAFMNTGAAGGGPKGYGVDPKAVRGFGQAGTIGGWIVVQVLGKIRRSQPDDAQGDQGKQDGDETSWVSALHAGGPKTRYIASFNSTSSAKPFYAQLEGLRLQNLDV